MGIEYFSFHRSVKATTKLKWKLHVSIHVPLNIKLYQLLDESVHVYTNDYWLPQLVDSIVTWKIKG